MKRTLIQKILYFIRWQFYPVVLSLPAHIAFALRGFGNAQTSFSTRARLVWQFILIHLRLDCGHNPKEVLHIVEEIIELPPDLPGVVVECGAFLGGSTAKLSNAVALTQRKLIVCDSFEGLPDVSEENHTDLKPDFKKGEYQGRLEVVKRNVEKYGKIESVEFVQGWYEETLGQLKDVPIVCGFWDVDLIESFKTCIVALWGNIARGSKIFLHDIDRPPVVEVFTNPAWWRQSLGIEPPQLVGAYKGLDKLSSLIGFVIK